MDNTLTEITFVVPALPPAINRLLKMHWGAQRRRRDVWARELIAVMKKEDIRALKAWGELGEKISVAMHVTTPQEYDEDNLSSVAKLPLDIMRNLGWIVNDDPRHLCFEKPSQERGKRAVRFTIRRVEKRDSDSVRSEPVKAETHRL